MALPTLRQSSALAALAAALAIAGAVAQTLSPSKLSPPLTDMKVRWDGTNPTQGGMKTFDSPRFGMVRNGGARAHTGIDLDAPVGTPIYAVADGLIELTRYGDAMLGTDVMLQFRPTPELASYLQRIGHGDDDGVLFAHYAHLSAVFVEQGQRVAGGTLIGRTGASGNADQKYPHLHFEVRKVRLPGIGAAGLSNRIDPELLFRVDFALPVEAVTRRK
jgi:murein DD-endopeptidase MepM/ murein hydrolase activator NlpD